MSAKHRIFPLMQTVSQLPHMILRIFFSALYDHTRVLQVVLVPHRLVPRSCTSPSAVHVSYGYICGPRKRTEYHTRESRALPTKYKCCTINVFLCQPKVLKCIRFLLLPRKPHSSPKEEKTAIKNKNRNKNIIAENKLELSLFINIFKINYWR